MKIRIDEREYHGTATEIMDQLRKENFNPDEYPDVDSYICFVRDNIARAAELEFPLPNSGTEARARLVFSQLAKIGALMMLEDD